MLTASQQELLANAWALHSRDAGMVIADDAYPDAHELAERGWLERRFEPDGELSWWWTREAEMACDVGTLMNVDGRQN